MGTDKPVSSSPEQDQSDGLRAAGPEGPGHPGEYAGQGEEVDGVPQEISMATQNMVPVGFVFFSGLFVSRADFGNNVQVWPKFERLGKRVGDEFSALEAELHGLINDPAQGD